MKNTIHYIIAIVCIMTSCKKDEKPTYLKDENTAQQPNVAYSQPQTTLMDQAGIKTTAQSGSTMVTTPGMNPPHGQPGHRCDIPVGQPLSSTPTTSTNKNVAVNTTSNNAIQIDPNAVSPGKIVMDNQGKQVKTAPGMNPPHGQKGHRCDIPVGQPLNSKPTPAAQPVAQNTTAEQKTPATPVPQPTPTGPKPAINPPHGEPWHDCAKKVGEAL